MHSRIIFDKKDREITFSFDDHFNLMHIEIRVDHDEKPVCNLHTGLTRSETKGSTIAILIPDGNIGIDTESVYAIMGYSWHQHSIAAYITGFEKILLQDISGSYYIQQNLALYKVATPKKGIPRYRVECSSSEIKAHNIEATKCDDISPSLPIWNDQENTPPRPHKHKKHSTDVDSAYAAPSLSQAFLGGDTQLEQPLTTQQESQPNNLLSDQSQYISLNSLPQQDNFDLRALCSGEFAVQSPRRPLEHLHGTNLPALEEHATQAYLTGDQAEDNTP